MLDWHRPTYERENPALMSAILMAVFPFEPGVAHSFAPSFWLVDVGRELWNSAATPPGRIVVLRSLSEQGRFCDVNTITAQQKCSSQNAKLVWLLVDNDDGSKNICRADA
jgi:hypothetical protein